MKLSQRTDDGGPDLAILREFSNHFPTYRDGRFTSCPPNVQGLAARKCLEHHGTFRWQKDCRFLAREALHAIFEI